jgi:hypothetical protein
MIALSGFGVFDRTGGDAMVTAHLLFALIMMGCRPNPTAKPAA